MTALPLCIRPCPAGYRVAIKRTAADSRERKYVAVFPDLPSAIVARDAWIAVNPPASGTRYATRLAGTSEPKPKPPTAVVPLPIDPSESAAVSACLAYAAADIYVRSFSRTDPAYGPADRARRAAEEAAVVALQRAEPRGGMTEVTSPVRAGDLIWWVDAAGELRKEVYRIWKHKIPRAPAGRLVDTKEGFL